MDILIANLTGPGCNFFLTYAPPSLGTAMLFSTAVAPSCNLTNEVANTVRGQP